MEVLKQMQCKLFISASQSPSFIKGFHQIVSLDYTETFSPIIKLTTIGVVLSYGISIKCSIHRIHINHIFLHGDLAEIVYMHQHPGLSFVRLQVK